MPTQLFEGDCLSVMANMPDNHFDAVVTDPPYHFVSIKQRYGHTSLDRDGTNERRAAAGADAMARLSRGFMGKEWDGGDIAFRPETWAEVLRIMKPGAHLVAFGAPKNYHRLACAIEDAGFEIRDSLMWVFGSGFPKSLDVSKAIDKAAGAEREIVGIAGKSGAARSCMAGDFTGGEYMETAPATAAAREWSGFGTALKPAYEPIVLARKPLSEGTVAANVLRWGTGALNIDATRIEAAEELRRPSGGGDNGLCGSSTFKIRERKVEDRPAGLGRWPANLCHDGSQDVLDLFPKDAGRFFYCAKANKTDRAGSKHPTVKPVNLMRWLVRMVTPPGGTILDPFSGSGTTGAAAHLEGFNAILIEREHEYIEDIKRRLSALEAA